MSEYEIGTYIRLYRKVLDNELFCEKPFDKFHAFLWLLLKARHTPVKKIIKGKVYKIGVGQLLYGSEKLADIFGWSRGKLTRFFELLKRSGMCTMNGTVGGTLITIENYSKYQIVRTADGTADGTTDGTADGTHKNKGNKDNKEYKKEKVKKEKSTDELIKELPVELQDLFRDFIEMRKTIKAPVKTQRAFHLLANKLNELSSGDTKKAKKIIEQSIMNSWKSFYEVQEKTGKKSFAERAAELQEAGYGN